MPDKNYRWKTFSHWLNLAFLGVGSVVAIASGGLPLLGLVALAELGVLWVAPDIKAVQQSFDRASKVEDRDRRNLYYIQALWDVRIPSRGLFVESRVVWGNYLHSTPSTRTFLRLREIVQELETIRVHRPEALSSNRIEQVEDAITMWLQNMYTAQNIYDRLCTVNRKSLIQEFNRLQEQSMGGESRADKIVLGQRLRALKTKVEELPALEQRMGLAEAEAARIQDALENLLLQVRTAGVPNEALIDGLVDRYDLSEGDLDRIAQSEIRGLTSANDTATWEDVADGLGIARDRARTSSPKAQSRKARE